MRKDFFISRAGADAQWAQWIADCLVEAGYSVVLQDWDFQAGQDFIVKMDQAMREADRTIAVLSRAYDKALFTVPEWTNAIARDPTGQQALLVPVRVDDIVPEGIFRSRIYINLVGLNPEQAKQALLDGVKGASRRKPGQTPFPGGITSRFPGALPPIWRLPSDRNPVFTGREAEIAAIHNRFHAAEPPPLVVALTGLGGVGKTALAVEYAHRHRHLYKVVWWVRSALHETLSADLALLAERLELVRPDDSVPIQERAALARDWLSNHDQWLLLLDEAEEPSVARSAIPSGGGGHVLVTSRGSAWRRFAAVLELQPLPEDHAIDFLANRSGQVRDRASTGLVHVLGRLPLAIELAGAFMEQQGIEAAEYLARLQRSSGLPVDEPAYRPPDYQLGLRLAWAESFKVLHHQAPLATDLLCLSAFLAPDDIPRPIITLGAHLLPASLAEVAGSADNLADLAARPRAFALISTQGDGYSMHRLVQAVLREGLPQPEQAYWAQMAVRLMQYVLPSKVADFRLWNRVGRLIQHALTSADHAARLSTEAQAVIWLLDRGVTFLTEAGGNAEEITARRESALRIGESLPEGPPHWLLNNHALWAKAQGDNTAAKALLERAIQAVRKQEGGGSPSLGSTWTNLGAIFQEEGQLEKARNCLERGLVILDAQAAFVEPVRATAHSRLGQILFEQGDHARAAVHFSEAVRGYEYALGPGAYDTILARTFLAQAQGEDPSNVVAMYTLTEASIQAEEGRLLAGNPAWSAEAERLLRSAVAAGELGAAVELADLLRRVGRRTEGDQILAEAAKNGDREALYWHAMELAGQIGLEAEPEIRRSIAAGNLYSWYDLGLVLVTDRERWTEAEAAFRAALAGGFEEVRNDLGLLLCDWPGREAEGEEQLMEAGRRGQPRCWYNLAQFLLQKSGRVLEAIRAFRLAANAGYLAAYLPLAYALEEAGELEEAFRVFSEGQENGEGGIGPHLEKFLARHPGYRGKTSG